MEDEKDKADKEMKEKWQRLYDVAIVWEYGSEHSHEEIAAIISCDAQTPRYYNIVGVAKSMLEDKGKALRSIKQKGYEVILPGKYPHHARKIYKKGVKRLEKSENLLNNAPVELMLNEEKAATKKMLRSIKFSVSRAKSGLQELKTIERKLEFQLNNYGDRQKITTTAKTTIITKNKK